MADSGMAGPATEPAKESAGPGSIRAAAVLLGLGPEISLEIFKLLDEATVRRIALGAKELRKSPDALGKALGAFVKAMDTSEADAVAGDGVLRDVASKALGPEIARRAFEGVVLAPPPDDTLAPLLRADPEALGMILAREQPQTAALVLSALDPVRASSVMKVLPEAVKPQILRRLAGLENVAPEILKEVVSALSSDLSAMVSVSNRKVDGKGQAVALLRGAPAAQQTEVMQEIEKEDPDLAAELRTKLFTFEDLGKLSDRDLQSLIREIDMSQLTVALKGATDAVKAKILKNMSGRAAQMLNDDIAAMGPVKLSAVEAAQVEVTKVAMSLAEQGRITIVGAGDKMV
jgi:flagellar motor switch protein FliG